MIKVKRSLTIKGVKCCLGPDWLNTFLKKQNVSSKNTTKLCKARYNSTKNPFIVNHWFDILEENVKN